MNYSKSKTSKKQKALTSKKAKVGKRFFVTFFKAMVICVLALVIFGACAGFGVMKGIIDSAPAISEINVVPTGYSTFVYDQEGNELVKLVAQNSNRIPVSIDKIPKNLQNAFVAIEDERFYEHNGIDIRGIIRAGVNGIKNGFHFSEGASTITQQLIKNNVFTEWVDGESDVEKVKRKLQEQYLAIELSKVMSKEEVLENYLNTINLGQNTLGVQAASKRYFNKDVSELNISECAVIAAITQNPSKYNPISHPEYNIERRQKVLEHMKEQGYITQEEYNAAVQDNVYDRIQVVNKDTEEKTIYSYYVDEVTEEVMKDLQEQLGYTSTQAYYALYSGGLKIYTVQDAAIQKICDEEFANPDNYPAGTKVSLSYELSVETASGEIVNHSVQMLEQYFKETEGKNFDLVFSSEEEARSYVEKYKAAHLNNTDRVIGEKINITPQPQCSFTIMDQHTGYVKAVVGGRGVKEASLTLNRATNTVRQPGSTFKVVAAYAGALDAGGMTLATVQDDTEYYYSNGRKVSNWYSSGYKGLCTLRYGIEQSLNIVAVKTLTDITPQLGFNYLKNFGFTTLVERRETANGGVESDVIQALALGGVTDGVKNIELNASYAALANGGTYIKPIYYTKILDKDGKVLLENIPQTTQVVKATTAYLLTDAMKDVVTKGTGGAVAFSGQKIAGKTGTTSSNKDVWFAGYTPYYTATVWAGYDNNLSLEGDEKNFHKRIWKNIMSRVHEGLEEKEFEKPEGIVTATVCKKSGKLARSGLCDCDPRGSQMITEIFAEGTVPSEYCDVHVRTNICTMSGAIATEYCPFVQQSGQVYIVRPNSSYVTHSDGSKTKGYTADSPYELSSSGTCPLHGGTGVMPPNQVQWPPQGTEQQPQETQPEQPQQPAQQEPAPEEVMPSESMGVDSDVIDQSTGLPVE
ncbi:MAG: PBP1A family penicillin-binding protein [Lachnospiraceae bacterium]|nr:PBP1A family penicillin-binding protein [Lachnospiraceae bacterium]